MHYDEYQQDLADRLIGSQKRYKALVLPTGSGKTRVALRFAEARRDEGLVVAFIVESDLHAEQVQREAKQEGIQIRFIPGRGPVKNDPEAAEQRDYNLEDYELAEIVGLFTYAGYFHGSGVSRADVLIVDDAHALQAGQFSHAALHLDESRFSPNALMRIRGTVMEAVPSIRSAIEGLVEPVHRGGEAVLVPPLAQAAAQTVNDLVQELESTDSFDGYLLRKRRKAYPHFVSWPMVVTKETIAWQPFTLPFESLGQPIADAREDTEVLLVTATAGPAGFLQARLGLTQDVEIIDNESVPPMGARLVLPYEREAFGKEHLKRAAELVNRLAKELGSVVVTTTSDAKARAVRHGLDDSVKVLSSISDDEASPVPHFEKLETPRVLLLVNRPSGVDIPASVCATAVHLDLPDANDGHGVLAGAGGDHGRALEASLAVRLSQLLGRLNRSMSDRSVHFLFCLEPSLDRGGLLARTLEPSVLRDLLVGKRIVRENDFKKPGSADQIGRLKQFLDGDDQLINDHAARAEKQAATLTKPRGGESAVLDISLMAEASRDLALGNWPRAFKGFCKLADEARDTDRGNLEAYLLIQALYAMDAASTPPEELYPPDGRKSLLERAGKVMITQHALIAAIDAARQAEVEIDRQERVRKRARSNALAHYGRLAAEDLALPEDEAAYDEGAWTEYWREAFGQHDHDTLQEHLERALRLLGSSTPGTGIGDNDLLVTWPGNRENEGIAIEVKGRKAADGSPESGVQEENVRQAADNAIELQDRADVAVLFTSKSKCDKGVRRLAQDRGVRLMLREDAMNFASLVGRHCAQLAAIDARQVGIADLHLTIVDFHQALVRADGGGPPSFE